MTFRPRKSDLIDPVVWRDDARSTGSHRYGHTRLSRDEDFEMTFSVFEFVVGVFIAIIIYAACSGVIG